MPKDLFYFLRKSTVDISHYLPPFLSKDESFKEILDVHSREHENLRVKLIDMAKQFFIETATYSMSDWEEFVGVKKLSDDLEARRARVKAKLLGSEVMTVDNVNKLIRAFTDGNTSYVEELNVPNQIKFVMLDHVLYWRELIDSARELMPAHLGLNFERQIKSFAPVNVGNAFGQIGYKGVGLAKPVNSLMRLRANTATFETGLRGGIGLAKPILNHQQKFHVGQRIIKTGTITIGADMRDLNNRPESYRRLKENAVADILIVDIGIARPRGTNGSREPEPEPDDDDYPFADGQWLRLYFDYPSGRDHPVLLINPRGDLIVNDVKAVGDFAAENKIFLNSKAESTMGIRKADLIEGYVVSNADDTKIMPSTGVLRIFFTFPTGNKRKILLHNIKGGLTIGELKELSKQVVEQRILLNAYNESSTGISHAAAVKSFDINKLGGQEPIKF